MKQMLAKSILEYLNKGCDGMKARLAAIKDFDILQGDGIGISVWFAGCPHRCKGCHNSEFLDFNSGEVFTSSHVEKIKKLLNRKEIDNLSILGGEPLVPRNYDIIRELVSYAKAIGKDVWLWTGFRFEEIKHLDFIDKIDFIIDGKYEMSLHEITRYKGSSNQRIINNKEVL